MSKASPFLGHEIAFEIQSEIDRVISQHEDRVTQQFQALLSSIHKSVARKLKEKDREIQKIGKSNLLLREKVNFLVAENRIWRGLAQTNEVAANSLRSDLEHALARGGCGGGGVDDEESCCRSNDPGRAGDDGGDESRRGGRWCRGCGQRESRVVLLPCGPSHHDCPACGSGVTASVRANLSSCSP